MSSVLLEFWTSVMGYNASEDEYVAWRDFFLREYAQAARRGDDRCHDVRHHHESEASCCTGDRRACRASRDAT